MTAQDRRKYGRARVRSQHDIEGDLIMVILGVLAIGVALAELSI